MRIILVNVPHPSIGSRIPDDHLPPLGLLVIGGSLINHGHDVQLIDAEFGPMPLNEISERVSKAAPDAVLFGHSGSASRPPATACHAMVSARALDHRSGRQSDLSENRFALFGPML